MSACNWEVLNTDCCDQFTNLDEEIQAEIEAWAVERLWRWTRERFGACEVSVRPCRKKCGPAYGIGGPVLISGQFTNLTCGSCGDDCSCTTVSEVILPGPIAEPTEILINGVELDLGAVRVDDWIRLVRIDGGRFPTCQDLSAEPTEEGTWQITYLRGSPVPPGGGLVAGILACEYAKALCNDSSCRLPKRVTTITRQGLTMGLLDNFQGIETGYTGIWEIDDWISSMNNSYFAASVSSPDISKSRRTTWAYADS